MYLVIMLLVPSIQYVLLQSVVFFIYNSPSKADYISLNRDLYNENQNNAQQQRPPSLYDVPPIQPACSSSDRTCEFWLELTETYTMVYPEVTPIGPMWVPITARPDGLGTVSAAGKNSGTTDSGRLLNDTEAAKVLTADGGYRMVYAVNGSLPGPSIVVYEGQEVIVHFHNKLQQVSQTLHWHGIHQRGTPYMDGVGGVSQCPIAPGESFTYRFTANPVGTLWYHSHVGSAVSMGVQGALIVKEKDNNKRRGADIIPEMEAEYVLMIQDWMKEQSNDVNLIISKRGMPYAKYFDSEMWPEDRYVASRNADGSTTGIWPFNSALINGRGRRYDSSIEPVNEFVPLSTYRVMKNKKYYFRTISSSMMYVFKISIDGHPLHVVSSDGSPIRTVVVDSLTVSPGERYDFWIEATNPENINNYWIRAEFMEYDMDGNQVILRHGEAILNYDDQPKEDPASSSRTCTASDTCVSLNCPSRYSDTNHTECLSLVDLDAPLPDPEYNSKEEVHEYFIALQSMVVPGDGMRGILSGIKNIFTPYPAQVYAGTNEQIAVPCDDILRSNHTGQCTNIIKIPLDQTVHLVLFFSPGVEYSQELLHPMHIHGYNTQVVAMGYPTYDETGRISRNNDDVACFNDVCSTGAKWSNTPNFKGSDAIRKDTIFVIPGGYTVLRFKADNPGFWLFHCHLENHHLEGMSLLFQVGEVDEMPITPTRMQRCGDFELLEGEYEISVGMNRKLNKEIAQQETKYAFKKESSEINVQAMDNQILELLELSNEKATYQIATVVLGAFCGIFLITILMQSVSTNNLRQKFTNKVYDNVRMGYTRIASDVSDEETPKVKLTSSIY